MIAYAMPSLKCESEGGLKNRGYKHKSSNKKISERTLEWDIARSSQLPAFIKSVRFRYLLLA